jgi:hypothetical protein
LATETENLRKEGIDPSDNMKLTAARERGFIGRFRSFFVSVANLRLVMLAADLNEHEP